MSDELDVYESRRCKDGIKSIKIRLSNLVIIMVTFMQLVRFDDNFFFAKNGHKNTLSAQISIWTDWVEYVDRNKKMRNLNAHDLISISSMV